MFVSLVFYLRKKRTKEPKRKDFALFSSRESRLMMIVPTAEDVQGTIELLDQNNAHQLMGEGHF